MLTRIKNYITYKIAVHKAKKFLIAQVADIVENYADYITGIEKTIKAITDVDNPDEIQKMLIRQVAEVVHESNEKKKADEE